MKNAHDIEGEIKNYEIEESQNIDIIGIVW